LATKCPKCGDDGWGTFTIAGVTHCNPICASAAAANRGTEGLTRCARCGAVGEYDNGYCPACQWWT
jgi:uncharacterized OB-fold protein